MLSDLMPISNRIMMQINMDPGLFFYKLRIRPHLFNIHSTSETIWTLHHILFYCYHFLLKYLWRYVFLLLHTSSMFVHTVSYYVIIMPLGFDQWNGFFNAIKYIWQTVWSSKFQGFIFNHDKKIHYNRSLANLDWKILSDRETIIGWCAWTTNWECVMLLSSNNWLAAIINVG